MSSQDTGFPHAKRLGRVSAGVPTPDIQRAAHTHTRPEQHGMEEMAQGDMYNSPPASSAHSATIHYPSTGGKRLEEPRLSLQLLGTPVITLDGERLKRLERCSRASLLLYVLALHRRGVSAETVGSYLASDTGSADAFDQGMGMRSGAVRTFIWRLRNIAGWRDIVLARGKQGGYQSRYMLPDSASCDLWDFEDCLDRAARLSVHAATDGDAADRAAVLRQEAILLYRGEFCAGIGAGAIADAAGYLAQRYLQAVVAQATYWKEKALRLRAEERRGSAEQADACRQESAWLEALGNYRLASYAEPYDETAYQGIMLCHAYLGQSHEVNKTFERCSHVLHSTFKTGPKPATIQMAKECLQIAARTPGLRQAAGQSGLHHRAM